MDPSLPQSCSEGSPYSIRWALQPTSPSPFHRLPFRERSTSLDTSDHGSLALVISLLILAAHDVGNFCRVGLFSGLQTAAGVAQPPARSGSTSVPQHWQVGRVH